MAANRTQANLTSRILISLAFAFAAAGSAHAQTAAPAAGSSASSAKAVVGFRIVVREALGLGAQSKRQSPAAPQMTRSTSTEAGRQTITLAQP